MGLDGNMAPSEKMTLGVIGIGPRCTYDLKAILQLPDVQCVAIADVQASRRDAGKTLVDQHYGNQDCVLYRDFRELLARDDIDTVLVATGDRWHAGASIMAAEAGKDVYSEKPCGLTIGLCQQLADTFQQTGRVFQAGTQRRSVPNFQQAVQLAQSGKLGQIHTLFATVYMPGIDTIWLPGQPTPPRDVVDWNLWLGPAPWRPYNEQIRPRGLARVLGLRLGREAVGLGCAHIGPVPVGQPGRRYDARRRTNRRPKNVTAHYANGVKLVLEFLETPFGQRPGWIQELGTCPVRFVGDEGSVETGDSGGIEVTPASLKSELEGYTKTVGLDVSAHARNFFDCVKTRSLPAANQHVMRRSHIACHAAALAWLLNRKLTLDPAKEALSTMTKPTVCVLRRPRDPWSV